MEVTIAGERRPGGAVLVDDPDQVADTYARLIDELGGEQAQRRLGIAVHVDRAPTHIELVEAVQTSGLSRLDLELD